MPNLSTPRKGRFSLQLLFAALGSLCFLAAWLAPNHYLPWIGFHNEAAMFAALLAFCASSLTGPQSIRLPGSTLALFAGVLALIWLQWAFGLIMYRGDALVSSLYWVGAAMAWWLGARCALVPARPERLVELLATLMVLAAALSSFMVILQWLNLETPIWFLVAEHGPNRPYANLGQPNLVASLLVMGQVFAYLLYSRQRIRTWHLLALTAELSFGLIITESRAGLLSAFCVGLFWLLCAQPAWRVGSWRTVALWWGWLLGLATLWRPLNAALLQQAPRAAALVSESTNMRLAIWQQVIEGIRHAPWLGYGWRQTVVAQKFGLEAATSDMPTLYAHNLILDLLAWVGIPLGLLLVALGAWWLWRTVRDLKDSTEFLLFAATIPFLAHSMVEFPFAHAIFLFPVAWIFGSLQARQAPWSFSLQNPTPRLVAVGSITGLVAFAVMCGQVASEYLEAESDFRVMQFEMHKVGNRPAQYQAPQLVLLTQLDEMLKMGRLQPSRGMSAAEIERVRKATLSLGWLGLHMKYVIALGLNGQPEEASHQLLNIRALYGPELYRSATDDLRAQRGKFPELARVIIR